MGGDDDGGPFGANILDQIPKIAPRLRIQARGGLVEKNDPGLVDQRGGYRKTLFLATAELLEFGLGLIGKIYGIQQIAGTHPLVVQAGEQIDELRKVQAGVI